MEARVPMVMVPLIASDPPTQYTTAVPMAPSSVRAMTKVRLNRALRMPMSRTRPACPAKPSRSSSGRPKSLTSHAPETLNRSVIVAFIEAFRFMPSRVMSATVLPTRRAGRMNIGSRTMASRVMRHSSRKRVTRVVSAVMALATTVPSVPVSARWAPITSLLSRLTRAPVCVRVKKVTGSRCTWSNRATRRSKMRPSPTVAEAQRSMNDRTAWARAAPTTSRPSRVSRSRSPSAMAPSMISRKRSGGTTPRTDEAVTTPRNPMMRDRYGRANAHTRRRVSRPMRGGVADWCDMTCSRCMGVATGRAYGWPVDRRR